MKDFTLVGFWKFKSNRIRHEDGNWIAEKLYGGTMAFSEGGQALLFLRSDQGAWGYSGTYQLQGENVTVQVETATSDDLDSTVLKRRISVIGPDELKFSGEESHTGRPFETEFVRCK